MVARHHVIRILVTIFAPRGRAHVEANDLYSKMASLPEGKMRTEADVDVATKWIDGLDRIQKARTVLQCFDFSATPCTPSGRSISEEALFGWTESDFDLNDAETGEHQAKSSL